MGFFDLIKTISDAVENAPAAPLTKKQEVLQKYNYFLDDPNVKKIQSLNRKDASFVFPGLVKIAKDCAHLVNTTTNVRVFFERYELLLMTLYKMYLLQGKASYKGNRPIDELIKIDEMHSSQINLFFQRSYDKLCSSADGLQTDKAKRNRLDKWISEIEKYEKSYGVLTEENFKTLNRLRDDFNEKLASGSMLYCPTR